MNLDETKEILVDVVRFIESGACGGFTRQDIQALNIALHALELARWYSLREPLVRAACPVKAWSREARDVLDWEQTNPKPFDPITVIMSTRDVCP